MGESWAHRAPREQAAVWGSGPNEAWIDLMLEEADERGTVGLAPFLAASEAAFPRDEATVRLLCTAMGTVVRGLVDLRRQKHRMLQNQPRPAPDPQSGLESARPDPHTHASPASNATLVPGDARRRARLAEVSS